MKRFDIHHDDNMMADAERKAKPADYAELLARLDWLAGIANSPPVYNPPLCVESAAAIRSLIGERDEQKLRAEQAETRLDKDMSGFSSNGVYVCGSRESIDAVAKWCHEASTIPAFRQVIMQERARAEAAERERDEANTRAKHEQQATTELAKLHTAAMDDLEAAEARAAEYAQRQSQADLALRQIMQSSKDKWAQEIARAALARKGE